MPAHSTAGMRFSSKNENAAASDKLISHVTVRFVLGSGLLKRGELLLLVRCRYAREQQPLWTLPGGRQEPGESVGQTVLREFREETSLQVSLGDLAYVSESFDDAEDLRVLNCTFWVSEGDPGIEPRPSDAKIVETRFVPAADAPRLLRADVLRVPVAAALGDRLGGRYFSFDPKSIVVPFFPHGRARSKSDRE